MCFSSLRDMVSGLFENEEEVWEIIFSISYTHYYLECDY